MLRCREEGQKTLKAKEDMEAEKQRRDIEAIAREKREAKEKQVFNFFFCNYNAFLLMNCAGAYFA
jgi:hypothetical protein